MAAAWGSAGLGDSSVEESLLPGGQALPRRAPRGALCGLGPYAAVAARALAATCCRAHGWDLAAGRPGGTGGGAPVLITI